MGAFRNPLAIAVSRVSPWVTFGSFTRIGVALVPVSRFSSTAAIASYNTILHPYLLSKYILGNPLIIIPGIWKVLFSSVSRAQKSPINFWFACYSSGNKVRDKLHTETREWLLRWFYQWPWGLMPNNWALWPPVLPVQWNSQSLW